MSRGSILGVFLVVALASACDAGIPGNFHRISAVSKGGKLQYLGVDKGELVLGGRSPHLRKRNETDAHTDRWYVMGTKIKSSVGGEYLAYDATGKNNKVVLVAKPDGEGTEWRIHRPKGVFFGKNEKRSVDEEWGIIQAASGPLKGWFLDIDEVEEIQSDGKTTIVRRFILSKDPAWNFEVSRMYLHL